MPHLILAGIPQQLAKRPYELAIAGWTVAKIPTRGAGPPSLDSCWKRVLSLANNSAEGCHVVAYHRKREERKRFFREIRNLHRLVWIGSELLDLYGTDDFTSGIRLLAEFELKWRQALRPGGPDSPLL